MVYSIFLSTATDSGPLFTAAIASSRCSSVEQSVGIVETAGWEIKKPVPSSV